MAEEVKIEKPKSALDQAFDKFQKDTESVSFIRKEMIDQLRKDLPKAQLVEGDKAMMIQAKMSVMTTLNGLLKDVESASINRVKLRLSINEQESAGQAAKSIVQLLKLIRADDRPEGGGDTRSDGDIQSELDNRAAKENITISEGELKPCDGGAPSLPEAKPIQQEEPAAEGVKY